MRWLLPGVILVASLCASGVYAICNTKDGNIRYAVNYLAVQDGQIPVCLLADNIDAAAVAAAMDGWNNSVGIDLLAFNCSFLPYAGIVVDDRPEGGCGYTNGEPNPACAEYPMEEGPVFLHMWFIPTVGSSSLEWQQHLAGHEFGHTEGFDHENICDSIIAQVSGCPDSPLVPTAQDVENYRNAYRVEAVSDVFANPASSYVSLHWSPTNFWNEELCNERNFEVWFSWANMGQFDTLLDEAPQDSTGITVDYPDPPQTYAPCYGIWSISEANPNRYGGWTSVGFSQREQDSDCDGWSDSREYMIGTNPQDNCGYNAWVPDFDNSREVTVLDVVRYRPVLRVSDCACGQSCYDGRYDVNINCEINILDVCAAFWNPFHYNTRCS